MRRLWVLSFTMCIVSSATTDTPQTSRLPGTTTAPPPSNNNNGPEALSPKAGVTVPAATTPWSLAAMSASSSAAPPAVPLAPTAAALVAPAATPAPGVSYAPRLPGPDGQVVLLTTPRTAPPPARSHTDSPMLNYIYDARSSAHKHMHHSQRFGPMFETNTTSITVQIGSTASIDCKISLLQDNAVSWVLRKPSEDSLRLLTVGQMTWSGDARHAVEFLYPNNWRLIVKNVTKADEGTYECQISTHPPKLIRTHLLVNVPEVLIVDEKGQPIQDKHYETSSTIRLSCIVRHVYMTGSVVSWIHQGVLLNQDSTRGGISVKSELREDGAESVLSVARVDKADSGNYTCAISPSQRTTVLVHVLDGESMAELHLGSSCCAPRVSLAWMVVLLLLHPGR